MLIFQMLVYFILLIAQDLPIFECFVLTTAAANKLKLLLSFAVGGLLGDVFLHLLPEAWATVDKGEFCMTLDPYYNPVHLIHFPEFIHFHCNESILLHKN